jgi:hypothetical protein
MEKATVLSYLPEGDQLPTLDRHSGLSKKDLLNNYVNKSIPVILTDAAADWPAFTKWSPDFFKNKYGHLKIEVSGKDILLRDQIDSILSSTPQNPAPYPYNMNVEEHFPELLNDLKPTFNYGKSDRIQHPLLPKAMLAGTTVHELFFGGDGSSFPFLHYDAMCMHTQLTQVYGDKEFFLYPPDQSGYMYPREDNQKISLVRDIFHPDLEKFPLFKNARPIRALLKQGETIFFPTHWWHSTMIHGPSITYGRALLNHNNWDAFLEENNILWKKFHPKVAPLGMAYGKALGGLMSLSETFM